MGVGLYDEQIAAIAKMKNGCILCGGTGTGKSRTSLGYYYKENGGDLFGTRRTMKDPQDLYIITTAKKRNDKEWESDMAPFLLSTNPDLNKHGNKVVIDSWNNIKKYKDVSGQFFIFDEQKVGGHGTWAVTFKYIAKRNNWILLSATPGDCWSDYEAVFVANGFFRNRTEFISEHCTKKYTKGNWVLDNEHYRNEGRLIKLRNEILIDIDIVRETVRHDDKIICQYDIPLYKSTVKNRWNSLKEEPIASASELCYELRRIVNSHDSRQTKLLDILEDHPKAIIFYSYNYELDILKSIAYEDGTLVAEYNGHKHQALPDGERWVYLVQYTSGCEGWNCITTDTIIFFSQQYSYKVLEQAKGRIDRLNTPFTDLYYYHFISYAPIDIAISKALKTKKNFNENKYNEYW